MGYNINSNAFSSLLIPIESLFPFTGGSLWLWGSGTYGSLGDNTQTKKSSPVQTVSGGTNWKSVACGYNLTGSIKTDGTLWLWGYNSVGQLGDNTRTSRSSPIQTISQGSNWMSVASGNAHTAGIKTDGTLWLWGDNQNGQLGDNTIADKSSPVQTISGGANWKQVACSMGNITTAAIKTDGTLWTWGGNYKGLLGDGTEVSKSSPVQTISQGTNWKQVSCGAAHMAAVKTDGTLWVWGLNNMGQLGNGTTADKSSPVQTISGGTNWKQVSCGSYHTAAIKTDGTLWLWGDNQFGELGDNTISPKSSPVQTISGGTNWKSVSCGSYHIAAIKTDGTLWLWGDNTDGKLGDNTITHKSSPVQTISGGTNWNSVACSATHTVAIKV